MLRLIDPTAQTQRLFEGTEFETLTVNQYATIFAHLGKGYTKKIGTGKFGKIGFLVNFIIQELKLCKVAKLFCLSVSLVRGILRN